MRILDLKPGREVGEAYRFLLELRLDDVYSGAYEAERAPPGMADDQSKSEVALPIRAPCPATHRIRA